MAGASWIEMSRKRRRNGQGLGLWRELRLGKAKVEWKRVKERQKEGARSQVMISIRNKQQVTRAIFSQNLHGHILTNTPETYSHKYPRDIFSHSLPRIMANF